MCDFLYISKGTLTNTLRQVEETYQKYGITVHKKPGYGIRVEGSEFNLRQCMVDVFVKQDSLEGIGRRHQTDEIETLGKMVYQCLKKYEIELSEITYNDFVEHIYVAMRRIRQEKYVEPQAADMLGRKEKQFVEELTELVGAHYQIRFSQDEKNYLALQLAGKVYIDSEWNEDSKEQENFVMESEIDRLVTEMLDMIYREFHVDFRNDFHLRMKLNRHMVPFVLRMKYHMILRNPMLEEIRKNYVLSYTMASQAAIALGEYFQQSISEDEIAGLAEIFELALEQQEQTNAWLMTLPCSRKQMVLEKYVLLLVFGLGSAAAMGSAAVVEMMGGTPKMCLPIVKVICIVNVVLISLEVSALFLSNK